MMTGRNPALAMRANGGHAALVSGGFTLFTAAIARRVGFDENRANVLDMSLSLPITRFSATAAMIDRRTV